MCSGKKIVDKCDLEASSSTHDESTLRPTAACLLKIRRDHPDAAILPGRWAGSRCIINRNKY